MTSTEIAPNPYLTGNYAPVADESTRTDLPVSGRIPAALEGRYLRIGPNPVTAPAEPYHWFLGDGMVHGIELAGGRAVSYRNRWVRTAGVAAALGEAPVDGPAQPMYDTSNTNVVGFAGRILALTEGTYPHELSRELATLDRFTPANGGALPHGLTAHPKIDPVTGELHGFSYWFDEPFLIYHVIQPDGTVSTTEPIDLPRSISMHDFAITRDHVLFFDQPYMFDLEIAMQQGFPFRWAPEHGARLGVLRRGEPGSSITWLETETCYCFHPMNAYDDASNGTIVVDVPKMDRVGNGPAPAPNRLTLERWTVDLAAGVVKADVLDDAPQEFCRVNESVLGSRHRFGYTMSTGMGSGDADAGPYSGTAIYKHDLTAGTRVDHEFGAGNHPGEFVFVADPARAGAEDGGWCMGLVHDDASATTRLAILDAQDFAAPPVAEVLLGVRVPYGFHGNWVPNTVA